MRRRPPIALLAALAALAVLAVALSSGPWLGGANRARQAADPSTHADAPVPGSPSSPPLVGSAPTGQDASEDRIPRGERPPDPEDSAGRGSSPASVDPADEAFVATWGEPTPALLRASIEAAVSDLFVDRRLTPAEVERATAALLDLRAARAELDALPMEPAHAARRRTLVEELGRASEAFHDVMGMSPSEFTARAADTASAGGAGSGGGGGGGIDRDVEPDYVPDDDFLPRRGASEVEP